MKNEKISLNRKLNILLVDDVDDNIEEAKALFIADPTKAFISFELTELTKPYFNFITFNIVGDALAFWEKPEAREIDIAIIDLDFTQLKSSYPNLPAIEYGEFRGADLIQRVLEQKTTTVFCITRYLALHYDKIKGMENESLYILDKNEKETNKRQVINALKNQARKYFSLMNMTEKYAFMSFLNKENINDIINQTKGFGSKFFSLRYLLMGWAEAYYDYEENKPIFRYKFNSNEILKPFHNDKRTSKPDST